MIKLNSRLRNLLGTHGELPHDEARMPLFITGCMRSGTTFLVNKLSGHPQLLRIGVELNDAWTDIGGAPIRGTCEYRNAGDADPIFTYQMATHFNKFIHESKSLKRHLMRAHRLWSKGIGRIRYDWKHIVPVNKSPHLINKIEYVAELFPRSRFLFVIRDVYAHSSSMKMFFRRMKKEKSLVYLMPENPKSCWSTVRDRSNLQYSRGRQRCYPPDFEIIPRMWIRLNHLALQSLYQLDNNRYLILSFRDLIENRKDAFGKIFNFLNLKQQHESHESTIATSTLEHKNTSTTGKSLDKWKKYLTEEEKDIISDIISEKKDIFNDIMDFTNTLKPVY